MSGDIGTTGRKAKKPLPEDFAKRVMGQVWVLAQSEGPVQTPATPINGRPWRQHRGDSAAFDRETIKRLRLTENSRSRDGES